MVNSAPRFITAALQKPLLPATLLAFLFTAAVLLQDRLFALLNQSAYYFSESLLFSTCWMLLPLGWWLQHRLLFRPGSHFIRRILALILPLLLHLLLFPVMVQLFSGIFYTHTFRFQGVLVYTLRTHLYLLLLFYSVALLLIEWQQHRSPLRIPDPAPSVIASPGPVYIQNLLVQQGMQTFLIPVRDITCIRSSKPYVRIYWQGRTYLQQNTLRALLNNLDPQIFIRVHKSAIVNIRQVSSYVSRQNGDYDARLQDGLEVRVSRIYAASFKAALSG